MDTPRGFIHPAKDLLNKTTVNRYLKAWGYDHFHQTETEAEPKICLRQYLLNYNEQPHRTEQYSRMEDWLQNLPKNGLEMCKWERFCNFACAFRSAAR